MGVTEDYLPLGGARSVPSESLPRPLGPRAYTARRRGGSTPSLFFFSSRETHHPAPKRRARRHSIPLLTHASLCCRLNPCRIQAGTTPGVSAASRAPAASAVALGALLFCSASLNVAQFARAAAGADPPPPRSARGTRRACSRRRATATAPPGRCTRASRRVPARGARDGAGAGGGDGGRRRGGSAAAVAVADADGVTRSWRRGWPRAQRADRRERGRAVLPRTRGCSRASSTRRTSTTSSRTGGASRRSATASRCATVSTSTGPRTWHISSSGEAPGCDASLMDGYGTDASAFYKEGSPGWNAYTADNSCHEVDEWGNPLP